MLDTGRVKPAYHAWRSLLLGVAALGVLTAFSSPAFSLEAIDRINHRRVEILALVGGDSLGTGSLLELALEDTREVITGEVVAIRRIGHDLELEILDRVANHHFFIEFPADGISELHH